MQPLKTASGLDQQQVKSCQPVENIPYLHCKEGVLSSLKKYCLSDLLPYDTDKKVGADLRNGLKEYEMLITAFLEAVNALSAGDLQRFDPLVGENACEIRAVWLAIIISKKTVNVNDIFNHYGLKSVDCTSTKVDFD